MQIIQLVLLLVFAAAVVISFIMRLRMGAINGAIARGEKENDAKETADRCFQYAVRSAIVGAIAITLCVVLGIVAKLM